MFPCKDDPGGIPFGVLGGFRGRIFLFSLPIPPLFYNFWVYLPFYTLCILIQEQGRIR